MNIPKENKLVLIDWNVFVFQSMHAYRAMCNKKLSFIPHPGYLITQSIITCLKLIGIDNDDLVCIISDSRKSWRKLKDPSYKSNRKADREKQDSKEWWDNKFLIANEVKEALSKSTPWIFLEQPTFEADDLIASCPLVFDNNKIIIVSIDSDLHQLADYKNVLVFSPKAKKYMHINNPLSLIDKKIECEKTDGLVAKVEIGNRDSKEYLLRKSLVDLVHLPNDISHLGKAIWQIVDYKMDFDYSLFPYPYLLDRLMKAYHVSEFPSTEPKTKVKRKRKSKEKQNILDFSPKIVYNVV